ncbi:MAG: hypothetical protein FWF10_11070 [Clostridiales bacterium]|nr:hypothetical protein [Clostridiales bacterium]
MTAAFLDIGSNSIRYMRAAIEGGHFLCGKKRRVTARLAEGLLESGCISPAALQRNLAAVLQFYQLAQGEGLALYAYATSAARDARNREEFLAPLRDLPDFHLHLLSGEEEARYAFLGAARGRAGTLIDIGGGSAQICGARAIGTDCNQPTATSNFFAESFPIGCVRAKECLGEINDLDVAYARIRDWVLPLLPRADTYTLSAPYYGVGGTITTLGTILDTSLQTPIAPENLYPLLRQLLDLGAGRAAHPLLRDRHDVIIPGGLVLMALLSHFRIPTLLPTHRDGLEGFAEEVLRDGNNK